MVLRFYSNCSPFKRRRQSRRLVSAFSSVLLRVVHMHVVRFFALRSLSGSAAWRPSHFPWLAIFCPFYAFYALPIGFDVVALIRRIQLLDSVDSEGKLRRFLFFCNLLCRFHPAVSACCLLRLSTPFTEYLVSILISFTLSSAFFALHWQNSTPTLIPVVVSTRAH
jgi:hypothetical protein